MILKTIMFDLWIFIHKIKRCFFYGKQEKRQKRLPKNSEKNLVLRVSIDQEFLLIARMFFSIDRKGIENRLIQAETLWWNSSLSQSIENSFRSIECYFRSIKQESRIDQMRQWLCDEFLHFFDRLRKRFDQSKALNFEFSLAFWLSVKTLTKGKVVCDEITHDSI